MRILILNWRDIKSPLKGGAELVTHEYAKEWVRKGHKVTIFTAKFREGAREEEINGIKIIRYGSELLTVHLAACLWYIFGKHENYDIVIDQFHGIPFFTPLYVRTKKIAFIHEVTKELWWLNPWPKPLNLIPGVIGTLLESWIFLLYRNIKFITVSDSTKQDLIKFGIPKRNITVILNGFTRSKLRKLPQKELKKTAIFLGAVSKDKGVEDIIAALSIIKKKETEWQLWITGKGDEKYVQEQKNKLHTLGLTENVTFLGFVNEKRKYDLLARAHMLVNASIREGWGLVNIEANSVGTPVVAYNVAGSKDSIRHLKTGLITKVNNPKFLAKCMLDLANNRITYNKLRKNALKWSENFTWEKSTNESMQYLENTLKNNE